MILRQLSCGQIAPTALGPVDGAGIINDRMLQLECIKWKGTAGVKPSSRSRWLVR